MPALDAIRPSLESVTQDGQLIELIVAAPLPNLGAGPVCSATAGRIDAWSASANGKPLVLAGLWLLAGDLDRSHAISQDSKSADGAVWHGIMHRREGDFWNAKYWFRQAGRHAVYGELRQQLVAGGVLELEEPLCSAVLGDRNLAESLVDCVETAEGDAVPVLERVCWLEWQLMMRHQLL